MPSLDDGQRAVMQALDHGPAHLPYDLFAGVPERVLAGMKVHANTISHARLVALEDTFLRTRTVMGHDRFNTASRAFLDQPGVTAHPHAEIGAGFAAFLAAEGETASDLARFEWLWLCAYHAADVAPLELAALAGFAPEELLRIRLQRHPAAHANRFAALVHDKIGAEVPGLAEAEAILITRPDAEVMIAPASALMAAILAGAENPQTIGNLLTSGSEMLDDAIDPVAAAMQALVTLINAGALIPA
jgi:hypothetical protein